MFIFKFNGFSHPNGTRCGEEYAVEDGVLYFRRGVCASEARYAGKGSNYHASGSRQIAALLPEIEWRRCDTRPELLAQGLGAERIAAEEEVLRMRACAKERDRLDIANVEYIAEKRAGKKEQPVLPDGAYNVYGYDVVVVGGCASWDGSEFCLYPKDLADLERSFDRLLHCDE